MARYVADQNKIVLLQESGLYASSSGTGVWPGLVQNHDIKEVTNQEEIRFTGNGDRSIGMFDPGAVEVEGTLTYLPQDWRFLAFALGSNVDAGSPSPYTHTMVRRNNDALWVQTSGVDAPFASFTLEDSQTVVGAGLNLIRTVRGCVVDNFQFSWKQKGRIEAQVDYVAQSVAYSSGAATAVTALTNRPFSWRDVKVWLPSGTLMRDITARSRGVTTMKRRSLRAGVMSGRAASRTRSRALKAAMKPSD